MGQDKYEIEISSTHSINHLKSDWVRLENQTRPSFFLSWKWISCWVDSYSPDLISVVARYQNKIVAIGLFTSSFQQRHKLIKSEQWRLHQTGNHSEDQIWIEFNDFIAEKSHQVKAVDACLKTLLDKQYSWDEIIISMMPLDRAEYLVDEITGARLDLKLPSYCVNLEKIRKQLKNYRQTLSSNTRQQINRSIRLYEKNLGSLTICKAGTITEATDYFHQAGQYHTLRWDDSGFKNQQFIKFHENLIKYNFKQGSIQLLKIKSGETNIAFLYYHSCYKKVYFYLQGLNYTDNPKYKPGLVAHTLATEYFMDQGMTEYHYMGGFSQYKNQLAKRYEDLATVIIQRPRSRFRLENIARRVKKLIIPTEK